MAGSVLVTLLSGGAVCDAHAQSAPTLRPDNLVTSKSVPVGIDTADTYRVKDGVQTLLFPSGWMTERVVQNGREVVRLVLARGGYVTTIDAKTHAPVSSTYAPARDSLSDAFEFTVQNGAATGWIVWARKPRRAIADTFAVMPFVGVAVDHLLGVFPFHEKFTTTIPMYSPWTPGAVEHTMRVVGSERLPFRGAEVDAWRVELLQPGVPQSLRTYWVDKNTGRRLKRENIALDGARIIQVTR
jgi:hypothetical protein